MVSVAGGTTEKEGDDKALSDIGWRSNETQPHLIRVHLDFSKYTKQPAIQDENKPKKVKIKVSLSSINSEKLHIYIYIYIYASKNKRKTEYYGLQIFV